MIFVCEKRIGNFILNVKKSKNNKFRIVQSEILTKGHSFYYLSRAKTVVSHAEYPALAAWVMSVRKNGKLALQSYIQGLFPKKIEQVKLNPVQDKVGASNEFYWCAAIILANSHRISRFVLLSEKFESCFLKGNYAECSTALELIEIELGHSQWLIENKVRYYKFLRVSNLKKIICKI